MAEKKKETAKKTTTKKVSNKKPATKKTNVVKKEETKAVKENKTVKKEETPVITEVKKKEVKKECKIKTWFNNLTLKEVIIGSVALISILLIILICVSTKNTKTKKGDDIVASVDGKVITANELYTELKEKSGQNLAISLLDNFIINEEYKTTDDMKEEAKASIDTYKKTYGKDYKSFLEYNGIKDEKQLKEILINNNKLGKVIDDFIKKDIKEKDMKKYYEESIYGDISAKHILISFDHKQGATEDEIKASEKKALKKANEIIEKLKNGEKFDDLAKKYSMDEGSKENGGDLGYFNTGDMVKEFEEAAYKLKVKEFTTKPVKTEYGYHIILKTGEKKKPSYKDAKDIVMDKLLEKAKTEDPAISTKALVALRKKYNLKITDKEIKNDYNKMIENATKKQK